MRFRLMLLHPLGICAEVNHLSLAEWALHLNRRQKEKRELLICLERDWVWLSEK